MTPDVEIRALHLTHAIPEFGNCTSLSVEPADDELGVEFIERIAQQGDDDEVGSYLVGRGGDLFVIPDTSVDCAELAEEG
jgi:hypothetical protein